MAPTSGSAQAIIFLHIPKTAGTSLVELFRAAYGDEAVISHGDFMACPLDRPLPEQVMSSYRVVSGHFAYLNVAPYLDDAYAFTFLREPLSRIASFHRFAQQPGMQSFSPLARLAAGVTLEKFLRSDAPELNNLLNNAMAWQLAHSHLFQHVERGELAGLNDQALYELAHRHLSTFDRVGLTERFEADARLILADLQLSVPDSLPRAFASPTPQGGAAPDDALASLPADLLDELRERLAVDYRLYASVAGA